LSEEEIRTAYAAAAELNSDEWVDHSAAQLWSFLGQDREFWRALEAADEKYPFFRLAHYRMASRAILEKRYEEALKHVRTLEQMRNSDDIIHRLYGELYWSWGKPALAIPFLERHAAKQPKDHTAWFNLGMAQQMAGQPGDALDAFRLALTVGPDSVMIRSALAKLLLDQERPSLPDRQEALELAREMLIRQPDDLDVRFVLVTALLANGRSEEAQSHANALASRVAQEKGQAEVAHMQRALSEARAKFSGSR
jgi:tetratricopeptide (TPR) repeat protein